MSNLFHQKPIGFVQVSSIAMWIDDADFLEALHKRGMYIAIAGDDEIILRRIILPTET